MLRTILQAVETGAYRADVRRSVMKKYRIRDFSLLWWLRLVAVAGVWYVLAVMLLSLPE